MILAQAPRSNSYYYVFVDKTWLVCLHSPLFVNVCVQTYALTFVFRKFTAANNE